jgi:hypothetical protein
MEQHTTSPAPCCWNFWASSTPLFLTHEFDLDDKVKVQFFTFAKKMVPDTKTCHHLQVAPELFKRDAKLFVRSGGEEYWVATNQFNHAKLRCNAM